MSALQPKRAFRLILRGLLAASTFFVVLFLHGYLNQPTVVEAQSAKTNWLQFGFDPQHSGSNYSETTINASNVGSLHNVFTFTLAAGTDAAPVVLTDVSTSSGVRDLVLVNSKLGDFYALDAHTGTLVWSAKAAGGFNNSSPAIDPNLQFVYMPGADGFAHKYNVADGTEVTTGGWPERITSCSGTKIPAALAIATDASGVTRLYGASSGFGSCGFGNITAIDLATGTQHVFNTSCSNVDGHPGTAGVTGCANGGTGNWSRAGEIYDPATNLIYVATAEFGAFTPPHRWSQSVVAVNPDGTAVNGGPVDSYTPTNFAAEISSDTDQGSNIGLVMPDLPGSNPAHVVLMCGKDGQMRLLNANDMSRLGAPGHTGGDLSDTSLPQGGEAFSQFALWNDPDGTHWVIASSTKGISGLIYTLGAGNSPTLQSQWHLTNGWVTSPVVANGIVFAANEAGQVFALALKTGAQLWSTTTNGRHWSSPIVANGMLYVTDGFGTTGGRLLAFGVPSSGNPPNPPTNLGATAVSSSQINLSWTASTTSGVTYSIFRSTTSGFTPSSGNQITSGVSGTTFSDTGLAASTTYFYLAEAVGSGGASVPSNQASATTQTGTTCGAAPSAPSGLGATATSSSQISLSWTASTAGAGCSITYSVFRSTTSGFTAGSGNQIASGLTATSFSDTGLAASTTYFYLVEGVDSAGSSAASNQASATTNPSSGGSCTILCIDSGSTTAVTPFVADEDFTGGATINHANTINTSKVTNPAPAAVYQSARVAATAGAGTTFSYTIGGFTPGSSQLLRLHFAETFHTTAGSRVFNVSINGTQVLTNFDIFATAGGENIANIQEFTENANASGQYVLVFTSDVDKALISGIEIDSAGSCSMPTAPSGLAATATSSSQINLSWTASSSSCGVTYNVFRSTTNGFTPSSSNQIATGVTSTTFSDTGLAASTIYYYLVEGTNSGGTSAASNQASATTLIASGSCTSLCINGGGPAVSPFVADEDFTGGATINHANTINTSNVTNPAPAAVYQTARVAATAGAGTTFSYTIGGFTASSMHTVRLHFCETFWTTAGSRVFNVSINGTPVLTNFDIFATAGGQNIANIQQFTEATNASGQYVLTFTSDTDKALISGIEID